MAAEASLRTEMLSISTGSISFNERPGTPSTTTKGADKASSRAASSGSPKLARPRTRIRASFCPGSPLCWIITDPGILPEMALLMSGAGIEAILSPLTEVTEPTMLAFFCEA